MTRIVPFLMALTALAGCGADGEPTPPQVATSIGVSNHGVSASTRVSLARGPVSVSLAL